ncbi:hypothetical protein [Pseudarthrobacter sp. MM222]|uniref:hypothetical protein n=1 Tax=Pseudarthrobacter sp. MM222 TaxID=3018929 RepID=UPI0022210DA4|nr:hypothetical protein [Pseudarthrobacter sp. MM222]CAI3803679.1 hypothetical protein NKCBBBOE_03409 [Pseudarthrobacter sp. MM222]
MDPHTRKIPAPVLNRRQFGLLMGGGALLLFGGGTYVAIALGAADDTPILGTAFGTLSVVNAGRLARLDAQGRPATKSLAAAVAQITTGAGTAAAFDGAPRLERAAHHEPATPATHGHDDGAVPDSDWPQPANLTWGDVVLLEVALRNTLSDPVLFAPGQLRLKLLPSGVTVTPQDFNHGPGIIAPGATEQLWISYLAPHDSLEMEIEYSDPELEGTMSVGLPALTVSQVTP